PDIKTAVILDPDFPGAPDALALAKAAVKNVVPADIALGPMTLEVGGVVPALDQEPADIVVSVPADGTLREGQVQIHTVTISGTIVIKPGPRAGRKQLFTHDNEAGYGEIPFERLQRPCRKLIRPPSIDGGS